MYLIDSNIGLIEGFNHPDPEMRTQLRNQNPTFETLECASLAGALLYVYLDERPARCARLPVILDNLNLGTVK